MKEFTKERRIFFLEGNIGAGKTTFLQLVKENLSDIDVIFEPTDKWQRVGDGGNILDLFYRDTKRWAYTFQSYAFISRVQTLQEEIGSRPHYSNFLIERSVYSDRYCFAKNCFEAGLMTTLEWQIYKEWFEWLVEQYCSKPAGIIYLRTSPTICMSRLKKRSRSEEAGISLDYLESLHERHEDWIVKKKNVSDFLKNLPVLVIDSDNDFEHDLKNQERTMVEFRKFIEEITQEKRQKEKEIQLQL